jgi:hypothetical protein
MGMRTVLAQIDESVSSQFAIAPTKIEKQYIGKPIMTLHPRLSAIWHSVWHQLLQSLNNDEPRIWNKVNRQGQTTTWYVYDPNSGGTQQFGSEIEVRLWLENRFYGGSQ